MWAKAGGFTEPNSVQERLMMIESNEAEQRNLYGGFYGSLTPHKDDK